MEAIANISTIQIENAKKTILDLLNKTKELIQEMAEKYELEKDSEKKEKIKDILDDLEENLKKYKKYNEVVMIREQIHQKLTLWESIKELELETRIEYYESLAELLTKEPIVNKKEIVLDKQKYVIDSDFEQLFRTCYKKVMRLRKEQFIKAINESNKNIKNKYCRFELETFASLESTEEKLKYCKIVKSAILNSSKNKTKVITVNQETNVIDEKYEIPFILAASFLPQLEKDNNYEYPFQKQIDYYTSLMTIISTAPITNKTTVEVGNQIYTIEKDYVGIFMTCYNKITELQKQMKNKRPHINYLQAENTDFVFAVDFYLALKTTKEKLRYCRDTIKELEFKWIRNPKNVVNEKGKEIPINNKYEITYNLLIALVDQLEHVYAEEKRIKKVLTERWNLIKDNAAQKRIKKAERKEDFKDNLNYYKEQINMLLAKIAEVLSKTADNFKNRNILDENKTATSISLELPTKPIDLSEYIYPMNYIPGFEFDINQSETAVTLKK